MKPASFAIAVTLALTPAVIFAESAPNRPDPTINQRKENQQDRIAQGIKSGQLTAAGTSNLEKKESSINQEVKTDRTLNGGTLTAGEKKQVNQQQNKLSQNIYNDKHNAATEHYGNNEVGARRDMQQQRIAPRMAAN